MANNKVNKETYLSRNRAARTSGWSYVDEGFGGGKDQQPEGIITNINSKNQYPTVITYPEDFDKVISRGWSYKLEENTEFIFPITYGVKNLPPTSSQSQSPLYNFTEEYKAFIDGSPKAYIGAVRGTFKDNGRQYNLDRLYGIMYPANTKAKLPFDYQPVFRVDILRSVEDPQFCGAQFVLQVAGAANGELTCGKLKCGNAARGIMPVFYEPKQAEGSTRYVSLDRHLSNCSATEQSKMLGKTGEDFLKFISTKYNILYIMPKVEREATIYQLVDWARHRNGIRNIEVDDYKKLLDSSNSTPFRRYEIPKSHAVEDIMPTIAKVADIKEVG
ncbi:MAG: hypothetical protein IKQ31_02265 [Clostridia bacterium]|nr:hypothetical protein [Clostridia bacterium]